VLELIAGMYQSAVTGRAVRREELRSGNPFFSSMNGRDPVAATRAFGPGSGAVHG